MKGSPILSTLIAVTVMITAYLLMKNYLFTSPITITENGGSSQVSQKGVLQENQAQLTHAISSYVEAHFSTPPASFSIIDPVTQRVIVAVDALDDHEWSGEIKLPQGNAIELHIKATWKANSAGGVDDQIRKNFVQVILSPDHKDDASATLKSVDNIDTTATFHWTQ